MGVVCKKQNKNDNQNSSLAVSQRIHEILLCNTCYTASTNVCALVSPPLYEKTPLIMPMVL